MTYLITFVCYGCHLHGEQSGSVDRRRNVPGSPLLEPDPRRMALERKMMIQPLYSLDVERRQVVLSALRERCRERGWTLLAAHVRRSHVHIVVEADTRPERVMNDLKSYSSRVLNRVAVDEAARRRWARHGSTRWLWRNEDIWSAIRYVVDNQGDPMAVFEAAVAGDVN